MKTVKEIIEEIRADIEIRPTPLDEQLDELLKSYEKEIDELSNTFNETCQTLAWYINERQRLLKVIEYSKPNEGLQRTIQKAMERPRGEWIDEGFYAENACQHVYLCTHCKEHIVEYPSEMGSYCKYCGSDNRPKIHGCIFASEECKKNPCADCGLNLKEGEEE